ncbi:MAG TPA: amidohydrolase family protein [Phycisphaerae bacterium]|nr:amidohydrolase family protein [Phycisphaerae bacterium]
MKCKTRTPEIPAVYTGPGLVELQVNGYAGVNFNALPENYSIDNFRKAMHAMKKRGIVMALPTIITDDIDRTLLRFKLFSRYLAADAELAAFYPGVHLEGPFISREEGPRGAHNMRFCANPCDYPDIIYRFNEAASGRVVIITLAPELPGAINLIKNGVQAGIIMSLGHCNPSTDDVDAAIDAGASMCTHLGNGSHQVVPRLNNYINKQLSADELAAGFIADGHHIPFFALKNFLRAKGLDKSYLTTDAIAAAEMGCGVFQLGPNDKVEVTAEGRCQIPGQANLAGSALTLDSAILNVVKNCGITWEDAWKMASVNPANFAHLPTPHAVTVKIDVAANHFELAKM